MDDRDEEYVEIERKSWNPSKCPECGAWIGTYQPDCHECGKGLPAGD